MAKRKNIVARIKEAGRAAGLLALALLLAAQLAVPAFAVQGGPDYEDEAPKITVPGEEEPGEAPGEGEAPEENTPPEDEAPPVADEPDAVVEAADEAEAAEEESAPASEDDILIDGSAGHTWDDFLNSGAVLKTGGTLTITQPGGSPSAPMTILVQLGNNPENKTAAIDATGCGIIENLRIQVQASGLALSLKNVKLRAGVDTYARAAIDFCEPYNVEGYTENGYEGTLILEGTNEVYASTPTTPATTGYYNAAGVRASKLTLKGTGSLKAVGADAPTDGELPGGDGIAVNPYDVSRTAANATDAFVVEEGVTLTAFGGNATADKSVATNSNHKGGGNGITVNRGQSRILGTVTASGGHGTGTAQSGGYGVCLTSVGWEPESATEFTNNISHIGENAVVTATGGDCSSVLFNASKPGGAFHYSSSWKIPLRVSGKLTGEAGGNYRDGDNLNSSAEVGLYLNPVFSDGSAVITGIASNGDAQNTEYYVKTPVMLWMLGGEDYALKGTVNGTLMQNGPYSGFANYDTAAIKITTASSHESDPGWAADAVYHVKANLNAIHNVKGNDSTATYGTMLASGVVRKDEEQSFLLTGKINASINRTSADYGYNLYAADNMNTVIDSPECYLSGVPGAYTSVTLNALTARGGDLEINGHLNAQGTRDKHVSSQRLGMGIDVRDGNFAVGASANLTLSGGRGVDNYHYRRALPLYVAESGTYQFSGQSFTATVHADATVKNERSEAMYLVNTHQTGGYVSTQKAYIGQGLRKYCMPFDMSTGNNEKPGSLDCYTLMPAGWANIFNASLDRYTAQTCPGYKILPSQTGNVYNFDFGDKAPAPASFGIASLNLSMKVGDTITLEPYIGAGSADTATRVFYFDDGVSRTIVDVDGDRVTALETGTVDFRIIPFVEYSLVNLNILNVKVTITSDSEPSLTIRKGEESYPGGVLALGQSLQLSAVAANVSGSPTVSWTSSKTGVATVNGSGLVTPKAVGTTSIKAEITVNSKKYSASCDIEVVDEPVELTSVSITPASTQLALGRTRTLHVTPNEGASLDGAAIVWSLPSSSPAGVVTLTPAADGKTASLKASDTISGSATVQVVVTPEGAAALPAATLTVNVSEGLGGVAFTQAYKVLPKSTTAVDITNLIEFTPDSYTPDNMVLSTSNAKVVDLEKTDGKTTGKIIAKALGAADITVEAWDEDDDVRFTAVLSVKVAAPITAGSFKLNAASKTMNTGASFQLKASSAPASATLDRLVWTADPAFGVVRVDDTGLVTAIGPGTATVKATGYDLFGTEFTAGCEVKVNHLAQGVSLTDADGVALSPTSMITLVPAGHEDTELPADRRFFNTRVILPVAEPSSTTDLVSVKSSSSAVKAEYSKDTGITLTGNKAGSATITVSLGKKKTTVKAQVVVPPNSGENTGLKFKDPAAYAKDLAVNASRTLKLDFASRVDGAAPGKAVAWSSSNPAIATVTKGKVKAVAPGSVTITAASTLDSRAIATVTLKVVAPITSIRFNQANFPMERDTTETLSLTLNGGLPASTEDSTLTGLSYSIDKPEVLWFVDDGGAKVENPVFAPDGSFRVKAANVEAKATAKVTVKSPEKSITGYAQKSASLTVTVLTEAPVKATALTFSNKAKAPGYTDGSKTVPPLAVGKAFTPTARVDKNASNKAVLWSITATDGKPLDYVVFDAATGKVTGKAPSGSAELTVTGVPMWGESTVVPASFTFKVAKLVTSISIAGEKQMAVNAGQLLTPTLTASATDLSLTWKSSNPAVVKLYNAAGDTGLEATTAVAGPVTVKTLKSGSATITATSPDAGKKKVTFKISVVQQVEKVEIVVPAKYVSGSDAAIDRGQSMSLKPKFLNEAGDAAIKPKNTKVSWSIVSDPKGAITLSAKGVVKGVADGTAVVRVTSLDGGKTDELTVTVTAKATAVAMGQASFKLYSGNTRTLTLNANTTPLPGQLSAGHNSLKWTIADSSRLVFADGQGTVSSEGSKSILTTAPGVSSVEVRVNPAIAITESQTLKCDVSVATVSGKTRKITVSIVGKESAAPMVKGITVKKSTWLGIGKKETLKAGFEPTNAANKNLRWAVFTDAECTTPYTGAGVTVSAKGQVVAKAAGTYYVRAESVDGAFKAVCTVYVVPKN